MKNGSRSPVKSRKIRNHNDIKATSSVRSYTGSVHSEDHNGHDLMQSQKVNKRKYFKLLLHLIYMDTYIYKCEI